MNAVALLVLSAACGVGGLALCVEGWRQPRPPLGRVILTPSGNAAAMASLMRCVCSARSRRSPRR